MSCARSLVAIIGILNAACAPVAWKQGGDAVDLHRDETACRAHDSDDAAVRACMNDHGWKYWQVGSADPTSPLAPQQTTAAISADAVPMPVAAPHPLAPVRIQSWWKAGAQNSNFSDDYTVCLNDLGAAHQANRNNNLYTQAMTVCLQQRGWRGK